MTSVRTATVLAPHQLDIREADVPKPGGDQVVVQIRYCGVCGTDVHGFESPELLPRAVFGHEWTGTIVDAGDGVPPILPSRNRRVVKLLQGLSDEQGALVEPRAVGAGPVITATVGLSELAAVLTDLRSGSTQYAKVLVDPTR